MVFVAGWRDSVPRFVTVLAVAPVVQGLAAVLAALGAALVLLGREGGRRSAAMVASLVLAAVALGLTAGGAIADGLDGRLPLAAAGLAAGAVALVALALGMRRWPLAFPVLAVAALPFRVPITLGGGESASLLVPLYVVIAAGVLARLLTREDREGDPVRGDARALLALRALAGFIVLYAVQAVYSTDVEPAVKDVAFFYVPFAVLLRLLVDREWDRATVLAALRVTAGLALLFALVGIVQWFTRSSLLANEKVLLANELKPYFRVNSLFFDPNIYGRYLALAMVLVTAALLWTRERRAQWISAGVLLVLWAGLVPSLSESSFASLTLGLAVLAALRWHARPVLVTGGVLAVVGVVLVLVAPSSVGVERGLNEATSGRADLISGGFALWRQQPVLGHGAGSFAERYRDREGLLSPRSPAESHTIPVTVLAEQGLVGLAGYLLVLWTTIAMVLRAVRRRAARAAVAAAYLALVLHTLVYAAFLEDPLTWALLAAAIGLRRAGTAGEPVAPLPERARRSASTTLAA